MKASELDLMRVFSYSPKGGLIHFMKHRALIIDAIAMGILRKELIDNLGTFAARNILTRMGYAHGWSTADNLSKEYPDLLKDHNCGPTLHMLQGVANVIRCEVVYDPSYHMFVNWEESYEAEQHLLQVGMGHDSVCWTLTGYVSGYCSRMLGIEMYCIEDRCQAKGDAVCHCETRTREAWGKQIEEHLPYFHAETIDSMLHEVTTKLVESEKLLQNKLYLVSEAFEGSGFIAKSKKMQQTIDFARRIAYVESPVLVSGESGVGKERIARFIHRESARAMRPFVAINCSAVTETLLESEFFGHVKGAFTGANKERIGIFEATNGGTLLLDEITELSASMQAKLLRVLQEKEVRRVGENISRPIDVRIIGATNKNLVEEMASGRFREDLFYRLSTFELVVPPLRERPDDILQLARYFLHRVAQKIDREILGFSPEAIDRLLAYDWPGNVRQLENSVEHAVVLCQGKRVSAQDLPKVVRSTASVFHSDGRVQRLEESERDQIHRAMKILNNDKKEVARQLGISLSSLYQKLKRYQAG